MIKENMDITLQHWSDRTCYYVTKVIDQKHIIVKPWYVCADHSKEGGMGHQDWIYFRTLKEEEDYLNKYFPDQYNNKELYNKDDSEEWQYRYNSWYRVYRYNLEDVKKVSENINYPDMASYVRYRLQLTDSQYETLMQKKEVVKYMKISEKVELGIKDYYFDWEF